jgi:CHAT domain-containing protein
MQFRLNKGGVRTRMSFLNGQETRPVLRLSRSAALSSLLLTAFVLFVGLMPCSGAAQEIRRDDTIQTGVAARNSGNIQLSIDLLSKARDHANSDLARRLTNVELGASLLQARRLDDAEKLLLQAYAESSGVGKARIAVELGNIAVLRRNTELARRHYEDAEVLAGDDLGAQLSASLNRARLLPQEQRLTVLKAVYREVARVGEPVARARLYVNLAHQTRQLGPGGVETAYRSLSQARELLPGIGKRLALETRDALAQLYEDQGRHREALQLTLSALAGAGTADNGDDVLVRLEWRRGRILQSSGETRDALLAYRNAARLLETIRQDLPIEYDDGQSSYRGTLQPIFTGLVDVILANLDTLAGQDRDAYLREAVHAIELTRQSEMQDFLGDRCSVDGVRNDASSAIPAKSALIYPVPLPDRLELLMETDGGIVRRTVNVGSAQFDAQARSLAKALSQYDSDGYLPGSQQFYDWILRPFEVELAERGIRTIVVAADGPLRLIPVGALHDGKQFAVERFAIATVTGMSMTSVPPPAGKRPMALLAGMSEPGTVVDVLAGANRDAVLGGGRLETSAQARGAAPLVRTARVDADAATVRAMPTAQFAAWLRQNLALPGVTDEIRALKALMPSKSLLNEAFTLERFKQEVGSDQYQILHIASHGVFGGYADSSYIMTYDDLLTMDRLDALLRNKQGGAAPIELLTLSACETAEGNDRAPLGISGAAIKAKARSVLGTLWPVGDEAARTIMDRFYGGLAKQGLGKAAALQLAQKELLANKAMSHPFYWAPFVLIGNWQ